MRIFLALEPDPPARERLYTMLADLRQALGAVAPGLRWVPVSNIHATLQFLGEIDQAGVGRLRRALGDLPAQAGFDVRTGYTPIHTMPLS